MTTLDRALETVMQLSLDQQELLIEILRQRHIEASRNEIAKDAQESIAAFKAGKLKPQSAEAVIAELRRSLHDDPKATPNAPALQPKQFHSKKSAISQLFQPLQFQNFSALLIFTARFYPYSQPNPPY
jgi:hypothetical protein